MTVVAEVVRNDFIESVHHGRVVALDANGLVLLAVGDRDAPIFPRSALKPLQAVAMLRCGWTPADDEQLAIACASHSGEPEHVDVVRRILAANGLSDDDLDNTPGWPLNQDAAQAMVRSGLDADKLRHNCSGKHAAMLATSVANSWPLKGYRDVGHPLQMAIRATVEELAGQSVVAVGVDGCGAPAFALSPAAVANAFSRLVGAESGSAERRVADAMRAHPFLVGGTGRDVTTFMTSIDGLLVKDGAEGVAAAATRDAIGVTVKIDDGAGRARAPVLIAALRAVGVDVDAVSMLATTPVLGHGERVGEVRAVPL